MSSKPPRARTTGFRHLVNTLRHDRAGRREILHAHRRTVAVSLLLCVIVAAAAWPFVHAHLQAAAVLDAVADKPVPRLLKPFADEPYTAQDVSLPGSNGTTVRARLYVPTAHPDAPGIIVLHGVHHLGMNEPRLVGFSKAMAAAGVRVLTPQLPGIADYHVSPDDIRTIGDSAVWLAHQNPGGKFEPVGVMGLSFAGGLALLAAADPAYHASFKFVVAIGSEDEMSRVAEFYRTGSDARPNGSSERLAPHEYGALVLEYEHLEDFVPAADIAPLRELLRAHLYEDGPAEKAARAALTPAQNAEADRLLNASAPETLTLLQANEALHLAAMADVSPHGHLKTLTTPIYLLHGAADNIIPSAETLWMAQELPRTSLQAVLISPVLSHVNLDGHQATALDQWRLVHFFALILHAAETRSGAVR